MMRFLLPVAALALTACGSSSESAPEPWRPPLPTATVAAADLEPILLTPNEAQPLIAKVGLVAQPFTGFEHADGMRDQPRGCAEAVYPAMATAYADGGPHTVHGIVMRDARGMPRLTETAVAYDTVSDAQQQLNRLTNDMKRCANTTVTVVIGGADGFDNVWHTRDVGEIEQGTTLASDMGAEYDHVCHRAIALRANVILDVQACAGDGPDPTPNLIDAITEKMT